MQKKMWGRTIETVHHFMVNSSLLNTSNLNKSILILILGGNDFIKWFLWLYFAHRNPEQQQWLNQALYPQYVSYYVIGFCLFWLLIFIAIRFKSSMFIQRYLPFVAVWYLCSVYMFNGYSIGIGSPATIAAYVNLICLGLVLFSRDIVYSALIPMTSALLILIYLSATQMIPYAPLFSPSLNHSILIYNEFWVYSMLINYIPIFFGSVVIFEILLIQWRNRENLINEISQKDPLTGVLNRRMIDQNLKSSSQEDCDYSVVLIDLDFFKTVNDRYGHDVGDHVLRRVAKVLSANVRGSDVVGRFGGEEFIMILKGKDIELIQVIAERCRKQIETEIFHITDDLEIKITASFGISSYDDGLTHEQVVKQADLALYLAKHQGRNRVCRYHPAGFSHLTVTQSVENG